MSNPQPHPEPARQLVLCCDGTGNTLTAGRRDTNVLQLYQHLVAHPHPHTERLLYYDPGVGTPDGAPATDLADWLQRGWERLAGLASGGGIYDNIAQAYLFLMRHWRGPQDRIFLFGFSRGAFTVRAVAGMVHLFGILRPEQEALLPTLLNIYFARRDEDMNWLQRRLRQGRARRDATSPRLDGRAALAAQVRHMATSPQGHDAWVHWVGVWDTVETVGLPMLASRSLSSAATLRDKRVRHARQALALDEHRWTFEPRLYSEPGDILPGDDPEGRTLAQRWFPGAHSDVGGGYPEKEAGLSQHALHWLLLEAAPELGLNPAQLPTPQDTRERHSALFNTPWWALAGMVLRDTRPRDTEGRPMDVPAAPGAAGAATPVNAWRHRRSLWPVLAALLLGALCVLLQGYNLLEPVPLLIDPRQWPALAAAASALASDQLAALWGQGLLAPGGAPWFRAGQPAWAWFWDLPFIACWGYLLARVSSRGFAWLAGTRSPGMALPRWRWLGFVPLAAVGADVVEDLLCLLSLALHGLAADNLALLALWLAACAALAKWAALLACGAWLALRVWLVFKPLGGAPAGRA